MTTTSSSQTYEKSKLVRWGGILFVLALIALAVVFVLFSECSNDLFYGYSSYGECQSIFTFAVIPVVIGNIGLLMLVIGVIKNFLRKPSAQVDQSTHVRGDQVSGNKISSRDTVRGNKVSAGTMGDLREEIRIQGDTNHSTYHRQGDDISVGTISGSQGVAIGRQASATVTIRQGEQFEFANLLLRLENVIGQVTNQAEAVADIQDEIDSFKQLLQSGGVEPRKLNKFNKRLQDASSEIRSNAAVNQHAKQIDQLVANILNR